MKKVGFVGLGNMGARMVTNLLNANYEVIGYDINEEFVKQLLPKGLKKASELNDISKDIDIIIYLAGLVGDPITKKYPQASLWHNENVIKKFINNPATNLNNNHLNYAITWFLLSISSVVMLLIIRRKNG